MTDLRKVLASASRAVTPSAKEVTRMNKLSDKMLDRVKTASGRFKEVRGVHLGGSFAKGTWLPGDVDLDIFVRIADEIDDPRFEQIGLAVGEDAVRGYPHGKKYAQHPYTEALVEGVKVNVVPCYDVKPGHWKSAADRSLYHVEFVKEKLGAKERQQVRLLKRFLKVIGVYGAEIEKEGFSGYASEVLVITNHSFEAVLRHFAGVRNESELGLSLRDPIDSNRELATAISGESVARMVLASRAFLKSPEESYFTRIRGRGRTKLGDRLYCVRFDHKALSEDTLWGELKKSTRQLVKYLESQGFAIARSAAISNNSDESAILLLPELDTLPELVERVGPSVVLAQETKDFIEKNEGRAELFWSADDGRLHMLQKRKFTTLESLLKAVCRGDVDNIGTSRHVAMGIKRSGRVLSGAAVKAEREREGWFDSGVGDIISDTIGTHSR